MSMMSLDELQATQPSGASPAKRRWRWLAAIAVPFLLGIALFEIPQWIHNHRLDSLADRVLEYPPPPETEIYEGEVDGSVGVEGLEKDLCRYRLRFTVETKLSVAAVRDYYKKAEIAPTDDDGRGFLEVFVWTSSDRPPSLNTFGRQPMIVEIQDRGHGSGGDIRCW